MFREMRRGNQAITEEECIKVLREQVRGVLSMIGDDGYPYGVTLDHFYNEEDGRLYFHGGRIGHRVDAVRACDKVSYTVIDDGYRKEGDWALNFKSVVIFGRMEIIDDVAVTEDICRKLSYRFTEDAAYIEDEIKAGLKGTLLMALTIEHMTGKKINEA